MGLLTVLTSELNVACQAEAFAVSRAGWQVCHAGVPQLQQTQGRIQGIGCTCISCLKKSTRTLGV